MNREKWKASGEKQKRLLVLEVRGWKVELGPLKVKSSELKVEAKGGKVESFDWKVEHEQGNVESFG